MTDDPTVRAQTCALARLPPLAHAFHWIDARRTRLPRTSIPRLVEFAVMSFELSPTEGEWLLWSLAPHLMTLAPKEPAR